MAEVSWLHERRKPSVQVQVLDADGAVHLFDADEAHHTTDGRCVVLSDGAQVAEFAAGGWDCWFFVREAERG